MASHLSYRHHWVFSIAGLALWLALGWPFLQELATGTARRATPLPELWLLPYALFGAAVLGDVLLKPGPGLRFGLVGTQLAAVAAMSILYPSDLMSLFLIVTAWQVAMAVPLVKALGWVAFQTLVTLAFLVQAPDAQLSYIVVLSFVLQLCLVFTAGVLRSESETSRALAAANDELQSTQDVMARTVREAERLRISRELHDAWAHELTALSVQLEVAGRAAEPAQVNDHVLRAKGLAGALLAKVRSVVATLRETEDRAPNASLGASGRSEHGEHERIAALARRGKAGASNHEASASMPVRLSEQHHWFFCAAALIVTLTIGWPVLQQLLNGATIRGSAVPAIWLGAFALFAAAVLAAMVLKLRSSLRLTLLCLQVGAVVAMAVVVQWAMMSVFLIIIAWQVALATGPVKALGWVGLQTLAVIAALALGPNPDLCWVLAKSVALQLCFVFMAQTLRREADTARALADINTQLRSAQAMIANTVREAERLRISRELHDAWGHELTALRLRLEIASHVSEPGQAKAHVEQAQGLAGGLLAKVQNVVATLREAEHGDFKDALEALAGSVPSPAIHVRICPDICVGPDQAHALMRCAQEAVTNAIKHAEADNLWLEVTPAGEGVRLVARNDGAARPAVSSSGSGLLGMQERMEALGGKLAVRSGAGLGFSVEAWLPTRGLQAV